MIRGNINKVCVKNNWNVYSKYLKYSVSIQIETFPSQCNTVLPMDPLQYKLNRFVNIHPGAKRLACAWQTISGPWYGLHVSVQRHQIQWGCVRVKDWKWAIYFINIIIINNFACLPQSRILVNFMYISQLYVTCSISAIREYLIIQRLM